VEYLVDDYGTFFLGFDTVRALANDKEEPHRANRPFDRDRTGFLFSEGGGPASRNAFSSGSSFSGWSKCIYPVWHTRGATSGGIWPITLSEATITSWPRVCRHASFVGLRPNFLRSLFIIRVRFHWSRTFMVFHVARLHHLGRLWFLKTGAG